MMGTYLICAAMVVAEVLETARDAGRRAEQKKLFRVYAAASRQRLARRKGHVDMEETNLRRGSCTTGESTTR